MSDRANQLQFLRFIAFCMIFLWHINAYAFSFIARFNMNAAAEAVSFFFILSGMVVAYSGYGKESECSLKSIGAFVWKKIKKMYPLYFITMMITIAYSEMPRLFAEERMGDFLDSFVQLIKDLLLIQSWFPSGYFSFNGVGWFLSSLFLAFFLTIPFLSILRKIHKNKYSIVIYSVMFVSIFAIEVIYSYIIRIYNTEFWGYVFPPARLGEYVLGMIIGYSGRMLLEKDCGFRCEKILFSVLEFVALITWIGALYCTVPAWTYRIVFWLVPNIFVLTIFLFGKGFFSRLFCCKPFLRLGNIGFECFLIHQVVIHLYTLVSATLNISNYGNLFAIVFCFGITIVISMRMHKK